MQRKWFTFQHFLQTVPHDMDVLDPDKLELDVGIIVFILVALPGSTVGHGIQLQGLAKQSSHRRYSGHETTNTCQGYPYKLSKGRAQM